MKNSCYVVTTIFHKLYLKVRPYYFNKVRLEDKNYLC